jgi:hypothetical protein
VLSAAKTLIGVIGVCSDLATPEWGAPQSDQLVLLAADIAIFLQILLP